MATSEGALIRSYERGMVALTRAGGVQTALLADENQIVPTFFFPDVASAAAFSHWIPGQFEHLRAAAESTTRHGKLNDVKCYQVGRQVLVNFGYFTGDAQGMNMLVKATDAACQWVQKSFPISSYFVFSGMSSEKRPSGFLLTRGKGKRVTAGALLPHDVLKMYLHCTAEQLFHVWHSTLIGHLSANAIGYNAQYANGLTAIFIATGQDVANVVNAACGITNFELQPEGLYVSLTLPALTVATVGGGTGLPIQREALSIMGCSGASKAKKFAEIVAAAVLGGEISMGAAITTGEFVAAHEHYGGIGQNERRAGDRRQQASVARPWRVRAAGYQVAVTYAGNQGGGKSGSVAKFQADARDFARAEQVCEAKRGGRRRWLTTRGSNATARCTIWIRPPGMT
jgi:hydroxymethylglutaryl-CoA reductase (NADPH)